MKVTTGIDIIEVNRIKKSIEELGDSFLNRIYTKNEIEYCNKSGIMKYQHYAARFAAKEAIYKAVSELLPERFGMSWGNAQIINDKNGNPKIEFLNIEFNQIKSMDISISHCKEYAVATVIIIVDE